MMKKSFFSGNRELQIKKAVPLALLLLIGKQALAEGTSTKTSEGTSVLEILGYVAIIIGVMLIAWFIVSMQNKDSGHNEAPPKPHKHFDHPNDPHFRKLKKKTS